MSHFSDPEAVARYAEGPVRQVPGFADLHRMTLLLLAEHVPEDGRVLIVGAGGGLEIKAFAEAQPSWTFNGVDPSREMLKLADAMTQSHRSRVSLHEGSVEAAPSGPFDGATCLLTFHFVEIEERRRMLQGIRERLRPGAPFIVMHHSFPQGEDERDIWFSRFASFALPSGTEQERADSASRFKAANLPILDPEQDETLLREAGFSEVSLFYAAFTFRGWTAHA